MKHIYTSPGVRQVRIAVRFPVALAALAVNTGMEIVPVEYRDIDLVPRPMGDGTSRWVAYDRETDTLYLDDWVAGDE